jgi:hypothetical protein
MRVSEAIERRKANIPKSRCGTCGPSVFSRDKMRVARAPMEDGVDEREQRAVKPSPTLSNKFVCVGTEYARQPQCSRCAPMVSGTSVVALADLT